MTLAIPESIVRKLLPLFETEPRVERVILFGSRARGDNRSNSDIDLAVEGKDIPRGLNTRMRESAGLYKLDIVRVEEIDNELLLQEIREDGILVYERNHQDNEHS